MKQTKIRDYGGFDEVGTYDQIGRCLISDENLFSKKEDNITASWVIVKIA